MADLAAPQTYEQPDFSFVFESDGFSLPSNLVLYQVPGAIAARVRSVYLEVNLTWAVAPVPLLLELTDRTFTPYALIPASRAQPDSTTWSYTFSTEVGTAYDNPVSPDFGSQALVMPLPLIALDPGSCIRLASDASTTFFNTFRAQIERLPLGAVQGEGQGQLDSLYLLPSGG